MMVEFVKVGDKYVSETVLKKAQSGHPGAIQSLSSQGISVKESGEVVKTSTGEVVNRIKPLDRPVSDTAVYEAGKEVPVSAGVAAKLGLISKSEAEQGKDTVYIIRKETTEGKKQGQVSMSTLPPPTPGSSTTATVSHQETTPLGIKRTVFTEPIGAMPEDESNKFLYGFGLGLTSRAIPPVGMFVLGKSAHDIGKAVGTGAGTSIREKNIEPLKQTGKALGEGIISPESVGFVVGYGAPDLKKAAIPETGSSGFGKVTIRIRKPEVKLKVPEFEKTYVQGYGEPYVVSKSVQRLSTPAKSEKLNLAETTSDNLWKIDKVMDDLLKEKHKKEVVIESPRTEWVKETTHIKAEPVIEFRQKFFGLVKKERYLSPEKDIFLVREFESTFINGKRIDIGRKSRIELTKTERGLGYTERTEMLAAKRDFIEIDTRPKTPERLIGEFYKPKAEPKVIDMGKVFAKKEAELDKIYGKQAEPGKQLQLQRTRQKSRLKLEQKTEQAKLQTETQLQAAERTQSRSFAIFSLLRSKQKTAQQQIINFKSSVRLGIRRPMISLIPKQSLELIRLRIQRQGLRIKQDIATTSLFDLTRLAPRTAAATKQKQFEAPLLRKKTSKTLQLKTKRQKFSKDIIPLADPFEWSKVLKFPLYKSPTRKEKSSFLLKTLTTGRFPYQKKR